MRVLIGCERSGVMREAFRTRGHDAWSCDLAPADDNSEYHFQSDVLAVLDRGWNLAIFHPVCTYLANSGAKHLWKGMRRENGPCPKRFARMVSAADFFLKCWNADIPRVAVENPIIHSHAQAIIGDGPTQIIQPWQFGHPETKATCLWLRNLEPLVPTNIVEGREQRIWKMPPGPDRQRLRSETYPGIAEAAAEQWGNPEWVPDQSSPPDLFAAI